MEELRQRIEGLNAAQRRDLAERLTARRPARLLAYVTSAEREEPDPEGLRHHLRDLLPAHQIPAEIIPVNDFPRLPNGKVDRKRLPRPKLAIQQELDRELSEAETALLAIWREVLGFEDISPDDDFFEIGGDSILSIQVVARARSAGLKIEPADFIDSPTIRSQAALQGSEPKGDDVFAGLKHIVPLRREGSDAPLFCLHSMGGHVLFYRDFAKSLKPGRPVYGVQATASASDPLPFRTIEEMAEIYLEDIRRVQPHGPYYFLGYCFGSLVGLEMAKRLQAMGELDVFLIVIDAAGPPLKSIGGTSGKRLMTRLRNGDWGSVAKGVTYRVMRKIQRALRGVDAIQMPDVPQRFLEDVNDSIFKASGLYRADRYTGRILFVRSNDSQRNWIDRWRWINPNVEMSDIDIAHHDLFYPPQVERVVEVIDDRIADFEQGLTK